jgi:hypothetical protein
MNGLLPAIRVTRAYPCIVPAAILRQNTPKLLPVLRIDRDFEATCLQTSLSAEKLDAEDIGTAIRFSGIDHCQIRSRLCRLL